MAFDRQMKHKHREKTQDESEFGLIQSCFLAIRDIAQWLFLEWSLEDNQSLGGLIVAKIGALGAIVVLLMIISVVLYYLWTQLLSMFYRAGLN